MTAKKMAAPKPPKKVKATIVQGDEAPVRVS
jgi:hypothetical protein